jgi:hypothetical protein
LENLALACFRCNLSKAAAQTVPAADSGGLIRLFNPRTDDWNAHFQFEIAASEELAFIHGTDDIGRATVVRLRMNAPHAARARWRWFLAFALETEFLSD